MNISNRKILLAILVLLLSLLACGGSSSTPEPTDPPAVAETDEPDVELTQPPETEPEPSDTPIPAPTVAEDTGFDQAALFAGDWVGTWLNITFGSTGAIDVNIVVNSDGTAEFTIDIGGFVFGAFDPPPLTYFGIYDADGAYFEVMDDPFFGNVVITISFDGEINMTGELIPDAGIATMESTGILSLDEINATYTISFVGGGEAIGEVTLTKLIP